MQARALTVSPPKVAPKAPVSAKPLTFEEGDARIASALTALLDPTVPAAVVAAFDFGVNDYESGLESMRTAGQRGPDDTVPTWPDRDLPPDAPVTLNFDGVRPNSRMIFLGQDVFSDVWFAREEGKVDQPWLEWKPDSGTYAVHASGAQARLIDIIEAQQGPKVKLYRGTIGPEGRLFSLWGQLGKDSARPIAAELLAALKPETALHRFLSQLPADAKAAQRGLLEAFAADVREGQGPSQLFTTPSKDKAAAFVKGADGAVLEFELPADALRTLFRDGHLYAGIETDVEVGLQGPEGLRVLFDAFREATPVPATGNIWADTDSPLWRTTSANTRDDFSAPAAKAGPVALDGESKAQTANAPVDPAQLWR